MAGYSTEAPSRTSTSDKGLIIQIVGIVVGVIFNLAGIGVAAYFWLKSQTTLNRNIPPDFFNATVTVAPISITTLYKRNLVIIVIAGIVVCAIIIVAGIICVLVTKRVWRKQQTHRNNSSDSGSNCTSGDKIGIASIVVAVIIDVTSIFLTLYVGQNNQQDPSQNNLPDYNTLSTEAPTTTATLDIEHIIAIICIVVGAFISFICTVVGALLTRNSWRKNRTNPNRNNSPDPYIELGLIVHVPSNRQPRFGARCMLL